MLISIPHQTDCRSIIADGRQFDRSLMSRLYKEYRYFMALLNDRWRGPEFITFYGKNISEKRSLSKNLESAYHYG